jgi:O-antigen ligase
VTEIAASAPGAGRASLRAPLLAALAVGGATALAVPLFGHPAAAAAPVLLAVGWWTVMRAPLRAPAAILAFLVLAADDSDNANGAWHSPFAEVGNFLRRSLRTYFPGSAVPLSGLEISVLLLVAVAAWRSGRGERDPGHVASPRPAIAVGIAYLAAVGLAIASGLLRGGSAEMAVWQTRPLLVTAALFVLFEAALRGPPDHRALGRLVVAAAVARAAIAMWVRWVAVPRVHLEYATDHGDSMLFTLACVILVAHLLEDRERRRIAVALPLLGAVLLGIAANGRRTAWLQLFLCVPILLAVARGARWRPSLARFAVVSAPLLVLYGAVGWNASNQVYEPVRMIRSVVDTRVDRSTWFRQVENWNLAMSAREHPIAGRGFGHEWTEFFKGDDITGLFTRYKAEPHNQVLGMLLFAGALAFAGIWAPFALLVFLAARAYPLARDPDDRTAALALAAMAVIITVQCFSDLGPFWPQYWVLGALALAMAGKLATATGALR